MRDSHFFGARKSIASGSFRSEHGGGGNFAPCGARSSSYGVGQFAPSGINSFTGPTYETSIT